MFLNSSVLGSAHKTLPLASVQRRKGYHWFVVATVCIGAFMAALDASIINIALPVLQRHFHVSMNIIEWISLVYLLTLAGLIVPFGRLADMIGRRWMYAFGFAVFIIGSILCGVASGISILLISRAVQAIGAAMLQANSVSIITAATPSHDRGKAIGIQASAQGIGLSLGPALGGALISFLSWRWIFFLNVPVGILGTVLGILLLPQDDKSTNRERFDYLGAVFLIPALVALIYFLNMGLKQGWTSSWMIASYLVFVICLGVFLVIEQKSKSPMVDLSLFKNRVFSFGNVTCVISFSVMYAVLLLAPFYLDSVQKLTPFQAGLYLTLIPIGMTLFTPISGLMTDRYGSRMPTMVGMLAAILGCVSLTFMGGKFAYLLLVLGLFLVGLGMGVFTPPNNSSVMGSAPRNRLGIVGGILNMSRTLGMGLGITLGGLSYQLFLSLNWNHNERIASILSFRWSFLVMAVIACLALILSAIRQQSRVTTSAHDSTRHNSLTS